MEGIFLGDLPRPAPPPSRQKHCWHLAEGKSLRIRPQSLGRAESRNFCGLCLRLLPWWPNSLDFSQEEAGLLVLGQGWYEAGGDGANREQARGRWRGVGFKAEVCWLEWEMSPIGSCVNTWSPAGGALWGGYGTLGTFSPCWEKSITQGGALRVYRLTLLQLALSFFGEGG